MTQVNLLPAGIRQRQRTRQVTLLVSFVAVAAVAALLALFVLEGGKLSSAKTDLATAQATNAQLTTKISGLQRFKTLADSEAAKQQTVRTIQADQVLFSGVLRDLSTVIPSQVYLISATGTIQLAAGSASITPTPVGLIGSIQIQGFAESHDAVALWLNRVATVKGWANAWVTSSTKGENSWVTFSGTIDLTPKAEKGAKT
jgi:Tfp pilus assembly protein PilN